jgi:hypothetical protein
VPPPSLKRYVPKNRPDAFNVGAILGVVLGGAIALAFLYYMGWDFGRKEVKFALLFPILGYPVGSMAWDSAFSAKE